MSGEGSQLNTMMVELLFDESPEIEPGLIESLSRQMSPGSRRVAESPGVMISHDQFAHTYADGQTATLKTVVLDPQPLTDRPALDLSQTWNFPNADEVVRRSTAQVLVTEMLGSLHDPTDRVTAFSAVLRAAIETLQPSAIWAPHSRRLVRPEEFAANHLAVFVNVRLFRIDEAPDVIVMDTIGLHVLRLPDIQCHFKDLDPDDIANTLYSTAVYLSENGDVIEDGNTITGPKGTEHWRCRHEMALIQPERVVLDVDTGKRHAAGERNRSKSKSGHWWQPSRGLP